MTSNEATSNAVLTQSVREAAIQFGVESAVLYCNLADAGNTLQVREQAFKVVKAYAKHWNISC